MRVLHVAETIKGGIASHLDEILPAQIQQYGSKNVRLLGPEDHFQYLEAIPPHALYPLGNGDEGRLRKTLRLVQRIRQMQAEFRPDIIHAHSSLAGAALRMPLLISPGRAGIVYCPHGWAFAMDVGNWKRRAYAVSEQMMLRVTDAVVNVSDTERALAIRNGLAPERLRVVHNGVALESPMAAITATKMDPAKINLLFVGRYSHQKGLDLLFAAARRCTNADIVFHIVGERHEGYDPTADGIPENVRLYGWATRAEVAHYLADADALVMPSRWEGLPMIALEAMRASKPIIANDIEIMREIVISNENGLLVDAEDADRFADVLTGLDKTDLSRMGHRARAAFEARFTSAAQIAGIDALYREIRDAA